MDPDVTRIALAKVREDKEREARVGFDGTWVAHPDLVAIATGIFDEVLSGKPNQIDRAPDDTVVSAADFLDPRIPGSSVSEAGIRLNVNVALQYLGRWLAGTGAVAIHNLMEDAATAEISRAQIWQWIRHGTRMADGRPVTVALYKKILGEEVGRLGWQSGSGDSRTGAFADRRHSQVVELLDSLILSSEFTEFLTVPAYRALEE
jgi:malate synthase